MDTSYTVVIPYVYKPYLNECLGTLRVDSSKLLLVDNTISNRGVAASWNMGVQKVKDYKLDWLIIVSAAMRFDGGGLDMIEQIASYPATDVIHFASADVKAVQYVRGVSGHAPGVFAWHCTAINRRVIKQVGKFDTNFFPAYLEDTDYSLRIHKSTGDNRMILPIQARLASTAHGVALGGVITNMDRSIAYFAEKWGRHPGAACLGEYDTPFNDPNNGIEFFPPAHGDSCDS